MIAASLMGDPNASISTRSWYITATCSADTAPKMEMDPETYEVRADGQLLTCGAEDVLPMAQRYFLF